MQEVLCQARFFTAGRGLPVITPTHLRWQRHEDGFGAATGLQAEQGAAVIDQVELHVPATAVFLELALLRGVGRVLAALDDWQVGVDEGIAKPILIGRPSVIEQRIQRLCLRLRPGVDFELTNIENDPRFKDYWSLYHELMQRRGVSPDMAKAIVRSRSTVIAGLMVRRHEADALICGLVGRYQKKLAYLNGILPMDEGIRHFSAMTAVFNDKGVWFFVDTHVAVDPRIHARPLLLS